MLAQCLTQELGLIDRGQIAEEYPPGSQRAFGGLDHVPRFGHVEHDSIEVNLIDAVSTNKTDFFREPKHFDYLTQRALPEMMSRSGGQPLLFWSAGCSSGEEPYTLAIVLNEYAEAHPGFRFRILATDISTRVLGRA